MALVPGTRLGPYEIVGPVGAGGMGEVYRTRDTRLARDVAVKLLPQAMAKDADALRRMEQEARTLAALTHPNLLTIYDFGTTPGVRLIWSASSCKAKRCGRGWRRGGCRCGRRSR